MHITNYSEAECLSFCEINHRSDYTPVVARFGVADESSPLPSKIISATDFYLYTQVKVPIMTLAFHFNICARLY